MNVIFLDIDGVLNSFYTLRDKKGIFVGAKKSELDEDKVKLLKELVDRTDAKIVLSSSWRVFFDKETLKPKNEHASALLELLHKYGMEIYSLTDRFITREEEVNDWLNNHNNVESFVILDDEETHFTGSICENLVKTEYYNEDVTLCGLTPKHVEEAINIINKKRIKQ